MVVFMCLLFLHLATVSRLALQDSSEVESLASGTTSDHATVDEKHSKGASSKSWWAFCVLVWALGLRVLGVPAFCTHCFEL